MADLAAFLAARLDEDKATAGDFHDELGCRTYGPVPLPCDCDYPARVLREVAAKRAILALHKLNSEPEILNIDHHDKKWNTGWVEHKETGRTVYWCDVCDEDRDYGHIAHRLEGCATLRHLAAVYASHPDYDPAWGVQ